MAKRLLSWKTLNSKYNTLSQQFRDKIESEINKILSKEKKNSIRFESSVYTQLVSDHVYADCRGIEQDDDGGLIFHIEHHVDGIVDSYTENLEEMDCAAYYEILLALSEKGYKVEDCIV